MQRSGPRSDAPRGLSINARRRFLAQFFGALLALFAWSSRVQAEVPAQAAPVVIVGEGPVGLITAIRLKMEAPSIPVTIYEKRPETRTGRPQTPLLDQATVDVLHDAGFPMDRLTRIQSKTFVQPDGTSRTTTMSPMKRLTAQGQNAGPGDSVAAISTGELEAHLRQRAAALGVDLKYDVEVRRAENTPDGLVELEVGASTSRGATPAPGRTQKVRFVVFADGPGGHGAVIAKRQTIATMPMTGAIGAPPSDGGNFVVRTVDPQSGETVSVSRLASGQIIAQLPRRMADATPAEKDAYLQRQLPLIGVKPTDLGTRLNFSGELAHGGTGVGNILVAGDATGAVPIVTSANLAIHIPLATKMASTLAKLYPVAPAASAKVLERSHKDWTASLFATREQVTQPVRSRLTDVRPPASSSIPPTLTVHATSTAAPEPRAPTMSARAVSPALHQLPAPGWHPTMSSPRSALAAVP